MKEQEQNLVDGVVGMFQSSLFFETGGDGEEGAGTPRRRGEWGERKEDKNIVLHLLFRIARSGDDD